MRPCNWTKREIFVFVRVTVGGKKGWKDLHVNEEKNIRSGQD